MRSFLALVCGAVLAAPFLIAGEKAPVEPIHRHVRIGPTSGEEVCATGCAAAASTSDELSAAEFRRLVRTWSEDPTRADHPALDTLLFHGPRAARLAELHGTPELDAQSRAYLRRELSRTHALLSVRMVDREGRERLRLEPTRIPLGEKQHLWPELSRDLQPPEISGTVKRVGTQHLWTRL